MDTRIVVRHFDSGRENQVQELRAERLSSEARLQATLHHSSIANLYNFVECTGRGCTVREFVDRPTVAEQLQSQGRLSAGRAVAYLQGRNIIHGDLKPA